MNKLLSTLVAVAFVATAGVAAAQTKGDAMKAAPAAPATPAAQRPQKATR